MRDHVGEVFNRWTVIEFDRREGIDYYWRAKCACGEVRSVDINSLKRGKSKSCGCYKLDMIPDMADITGHQFGKWTVVGFDRRDKEGGDRYYWWVECSCKDKTRKSVRLDILKAGKSQSCGCHKLEVLTFPWGEAARNKVKDNYIRGAQSRGYEWKLTEEEFDELTSGDCYYCGRHPGNVSKTGNGTGDFVYNGIDRVDNTVGYVYENSVTCCEICNKAKRNMSYAGFVAWIKDLALFNISKFLVEEV